MGDMSRAFKPEDVPNFTHYAVIIFDKRTITREGCWTPSKVETWTEEFSSQEYWHTTEKKTLEDFILGLQIEKRGRNDFVILSVAGRLRTETKISFVGA